jgi:hypothetical protein
MIRHHVQMRGRILGADLKVCAMSTMVTFGVAGVATGGSPIAFLLSGVLGLVVGLAVTQREPDTMTLLGLVRWKARKPDRSGQVLWYRP